MEPADVLTRAAQLPDAVLRYGEHEEALVDVRLPDGPAPRPLVVLLHGGFWKQQWDRRHTRPLADALAAEGFVVASPEYRRVGGGGGWPATFDDVTAAIAALPDLLAGLGVRTTTTTLLGHSAGGQLALWLANEPYQVDRVVGLAPVGDLRAAAREGLGDFATQALLGGGPDAVPQRYDAADPATRLHSRPRAQVVVVHGTDDTAVPVANSRGLALRHPFVELRELPRVEHFALIDPRSAAWPAVLAAVRAAGPGMLEP